MDVEVIVEVDIVANGPGGRRNGGGEWKGQKKRRGRETIEESGESRDGGERTVRIILPRGEMGTAETSSESNLMRLTRTTTLSTTTSARLEPLSKSQSQTCISQPLALALPVFVSLSFLQEQKEEKEETLSVMLDDDRKDFRAASTDMACLGYVVSSLALDSDQEARAGKQRGRGRAAAKDQARATRSAPSMRPRRARRIQRNKEEGRLRSVGVGFGDFGCNASGTFGAKPKEAKKGEEGTERSIGAEVQSRVGGKSMCIFRRASS